MYPGEYTLIGNELSFSLANSRPNYVFSEFPGTTSSKLKQGEKRSKPRLARISFPYCRRPIDGYYKTPLRLGLF